MKKLLALFIVGLVVLSGCTWFAPAENDVMVEDEEKTTEDVMEEEEEPVVEEQLTAEEESELVERTVYQNKACGFKMTFPATWGSLEETQTGELEGVEPLRLTVASTTHEGMELKLDLIRGDHSPDRAAVGKTNKCYVYLEKTMVAEDVKEITDTFEALEVSEEEPATAEASSESAEIVLAKCMTDSGAKLFTAKWCGHCKSQKAAFGDGLEYLNDTECAEGDGWAQACDEANVKAVPTWIFGDGTVKTGNTPLAKLAELTGCEYNA